jgi:hypothetical protein
MNERIEELADLAAYDTRAIHNNAYWWMQEELAEDATWRERFAELIVRECASICEEHPAWTARMVGNQIKDHFGVE